MYIIKTCVLFPDDCQTRKFLSLISLITRFYPQGAGAVTVHPAIFPFFWGNKFGMRHYQSSSIMNFSLGLSSCPKFIILKCVQQKYKAMFQGDTEEVL